MAKRPSRTVIAFTLSFLAGCVQGKNEDDLFQAIASSDTNKVAQLVDNHGQDVRDSYGRSPLVAAAVSGNPSIVRLLLSKHASANQEFNGIPLITISATQIPCRQAVLKELIQAGADPNAVSHISPEAPVLGASSFGSYECVVELLKGGANPNAIDTKGRGVLSLMAVSGDQNSFDLLIKAMPVLASNTIDAQAALVYSARLGLERNLELLLNNGVNPCPLFDKKIEESWQGKISPASAKRMLAACKNQPA